MSPMPPIQRGCFKMLILKNGLTNSNKNRLDYRQMVIQPSFLNGQFGRKSYFDTAPFLLYFFAPGNGNRSHHPGYRKGCGPAGLLQSTFQGIPLGNSRQKIAGEGIPRSGCIHCLGLIGLLSDCPVPFLAKASICPKRKDHSTFRVLPVHRLQNSPEEQPILANPSPHESLWPQPWLRQYFLLEKPSYRLRPGFLPGPQNGAPGRHSPYSKNPGYIGPIFISFPR